MSQELTPSESKIYIYLRSLSKDDDKYAEINDVAEVATILDLSESGVYLGLKTLEAKALVHVFYKNGRGSGKRSIKIYMFNYEKNVNALDAALTHLQSASAIFESLRKTEIEQQRRTEALEIENQNKDIKIAELQERLSVFQHLQDYITGKETESRSLS
jgi:predicted ArsR family transcriptional regulator